MQQRVQFINDDQLPIGMDWALVDEPTSGDPAVLFIKRSACTGRCGAGCPILAEVRAIVA